MQNATTRTIDDGTHANRLWAPTGVMAQSGILFRRTWAIFLREPSLNLRGHSALQEDLGTISRDVPPVLLFQ